MQITSDVMLQLLTLSQETRQLIRTINEETKDSEDHQQLLLSLGFPTMIKRQEELYDPYPKTFEWMFERQSPRIRLYTGFLDWLELRGGIYWINGKPGSGKSTVSRCPISGCIRICTETQQLMKFLVENPKLRFACPSTWLPLYDMPSS